MVGVVAVTVTGVMDIVAGEEAAECIVVVVKEAMGTVEVVEGFVVAVMGAMDTVAVVTEMMEVMGTVVEEEVGTVVAVMEATDIVMEVVDTAVEAMGTAVEVVDTAVEVMDTVVEEVGTAAEGTGAAGILVVVETVDIVVVAAAGPIVAEVVVALPKEADLVAPAVVVDTIRVEAVEGLMALRAAMEVVAVVSEVVVVAAVVASIVAVAGVVVVVADEVVEVVVRVPMQPEVEEEGAAAGGARSLQTHQSWSRPHLCRLRSLLKPSSKQSQPPF